MKLLKKKSQILFLYEKYTKFAYEKYDVLQI